MMKTHLLSFLISVLFVCQIGNAQTDSAATQPDSLNADFINVYLDGAFNYQDYIKQQITFVNYVRDRFKADVHILISGQLTGSGGVDYNIFFLGANRFPAKNDTLHYIAGTNNTDDEIRVGLTQVIKMGLMPYVAKLNNALPIDISYSGASSSEEKQEDDKWKGWVYSISSYGNASVNAAVQSYYISGFLSAKKITEEWKILANTGVNFNTDIYDLGDGDVFIGNNNSLNTNVTIVKSLNDHWSFGGEAFHTSSTYSNYDNYFSVSPAIEYDVYPYSDNATRLLTIFYKIGPEYQDYTDTTLFGETEALLLRQRLDVSLSLTQKWGSLSMGVNGSNYFHDLSKNGAGLFASFNWRIVEGLNFNGFITFDFINDQINLAKGDLSDEEILLQISEQQTNYSFFTYFGLSYTFGSIYNNIVNPRFEGGNTYFF